MKRVLKAAFPYVVWALTALLFVNWAFDRVTDPPRERQLIVCTDGCPADTAGLEKVLAREMPAGVRYVRVHSLAYSFFDVSDGLPEADVYILPASEAEEYKDDLIFAGAAFQNGEALPALAPYFSFTEGGAAGEDYALYVGSRSPHKDGAVKDLLELLTAHDNTEE